MWPYPTVVAHRGAGTLAPENTLAAMAFGAALGFRAVEFDVMLARDDVPVVLHDHRLGRTVAARGQVAEHDSAALMNMDAGSWFGPDYAHARVPSLRQVLSFCHANGIWMNVEIKPSPGREVLTGRLVAAAVETFMRELKPPEPIADAPLALAERQALRPAPLPPLLSSFSIEALEAAREAAPGLSCACLFDRLPGDWLARVSAVAARAVHLNHRHLSAAGAAKIKAQQLGLFCYTVNNPMRAHELLAWGMDGFCTDRIDLMGPDFAA